MGLDMPLNERTILKKENDSIMLVSDENTTFWQKGNAIHTYFEKTLKHKLKKYQDYKVTCDQLKNLLIIIDNVQSNNTLGGINMTQQIDIYTEKDGSYMHSIVQTDENIANYVASLSPSQRVKLVELSTDNLILTTIGKFIDFVPNKQWFMQSLSPLILPKQLGETPIEPVTTFDKYAMKDTEE